MGHTGHTNRYYTVNVLNTNNLKLLWYTRYVIYLIIIKKPIIIPPTYEVCQGVYSFCHSVRLFVRLYVCLFINFTSKFFVKPLTIAQISVTTYQNLLTFSSWYLSIIAFYASYLIPWVKQLVLRHFHYVKVCVKALTIAQISVTTYQILFTFGSWYLCIIVFYASYLIPGGGPGVNN